MLAAGLLAADLTPIAASWLLYITYFVVNPAFQTLSAYRGFDASFATTLLVITGMSNAFGRIVIPVVSDKIGNERTILVLMLITTLASTALIFVSGSLFVVMVALIPMCFGASLSIFPLLTADYFGIRNLGSNYGAIMIGFAVSALILPGVIGILGGYTPRFVAVAILSALGIFAIGPLIVQVKRKVFAKA